MNFRLPTPPIYSANGITFLFLQTLLCGMVLNDPRSLYLGSWDLSALAGFIILNFCFLPALLAIVFLAIYRLGEKQFNYFIFGLTAFLISREMDYFIFRELFIERLFLRIIILFFLFSILFFAIYKIKEFSFSFFKISPILSLVLAAYFAYETAGILANNSEINQSRYSARVPIPENTQRHPIFLLTFERVVYDYLFADGREIESTAFPNFARLTNVSNVYHNAYANGTFTWTALLHLYKGTYKKNLKANSPDSRDRSKSHSFADIFGERGWRVVFVTDTATHICDKKRHICINALGDNTFKRRWALLRAWYQEYIKVFLPTGLLAHVGLLPTWDVVLWEDVVDREDLRQTKGLGRTVSADDLGRFEMEALIKAIDSFSHVPTLFIAHNLFNHNNSIKTSAFYGRTESQYEEELKPVRAAYQQLDALLGEFLEALDRNGLFDGSTIIVTSDTGNDPAEAKFINGQAELLDTPELARIFMAIKFPFQSNRVDFDYPISQVDVLPTVIKGIDLDVAVTGMDGIVALNPHRGRSLQKEPIYLFPRNGNAYRLVKPYDKWIKVD